MSHARTLTLYESLAPFWFWINRFRVLPRADRLFDDADPGRILERRLFGFHFPCDVSKRGPSRLIFVEGERFIAERKIITRLLKPGFRVVDVGANIGYYCLMFCRAIGPTGRIVAVEPSPENLPLLELAIRRNGMTDRVEVVSCAVGDEPGVVGLGSGTNSGVLKAANDAPFRVRLDTLDNLIQGPIDMLKIDVEGFEAFALRGAKRILREQRPTLFIEIHPAHLLALGSSAVEIIQLLHEFYDDVAVYDQDRNAGLIRKFMRLYFWYGPRKVRDIAAYLSRVSKEADAAPFWAVCQKHRTDA